MIDKIAHIDLDSFFVSCERLVNTSLTGKPVIIGGGSDRGVVSSCSYEARYYGVRSAMPMKYALRLCPEAQVVRGDMDLYSKKSKLVTEIIAEQAPVLEKASIDEFYLDVSGMDKFHGTYKWTNELVQKVTNESGLPLSFGLSVNKTVAKMATSESKPLGRLHIEALNVQPFLNPLSIIKIPMLGSSTYQVLSRIGVRKIYTLAEMPVEFLSELLGKNGVSLWKKANGQDSSKVQPYRESKSISAERTFLKDTMDLKELRAVLIKLVERVAYDLRKQGKLASIIAVKIRYTNFDTHTKQQHITYSSSDQTFIRRAMELFDKLFERRMMLRLIGVKLSGLVQGNHQINMFDDRVQNLKLYEAMDRMKNKYGVSTIVRGCQIKPETPEDVS